MIIPHLLLQDQQPWYCSQLQWKLSLVARLPTSISALGLLYESNPAEVDAVVQDHTEDLGYFPKVHTTDLDCIFDDSTYHKLLIL